jgi:hypothetical protein
MYSTDTTIALVARAHRDVPAKMVTASLPHAMPAQDTDLRGDAHWLVCSAVICVPQLATFHLHLPEGAASSSGQAGPFVLAHETEPKSSPFRCSQRQSGSFGSWPGRRVRRVFSSRSLARCSWVSLCGC